MKTTFITLTILELIDTAIDAFKNIFLEYDSEMCSTANNDKTKIYRNNTGAYFCVLCKSFGDKKPSFREFFQNIFYVGKGMHDRCFQHLELVQDMVGNLDKDDVKGNIIANNWRNGMGIYVVSGFHCSTNEESFNREAAVIDCIGLDKLTNKIKGTKYGNIVKWNDIKTYNYGMFLLYTLYLKFINENIKCIYCNDISPKKNIK